MDKFKARNAVLLTIALILIIFRPGEPEAEADTINIPIDSLKTIDLEPQVIIKKYRGVSLTSKRLCAYDTIKTQTAVQPKVEVLTDQIVQTINSTVWTKREATAYNAGDPEQCGNDKGLGTYRSTDILKGLAQGKKYVAANFVPLGSWLEIRDSMKSLGYFQVVDRTSEKYAHRVDIAFPRYAKEAALQFGKQDLFVRLVDRQSVKK